MRLRLPSAAGCGSEAGGKPNVISQDIGNGLNLRWTSRQRSWYSYQSHPSPAPSAPARTRRSQRCPNAVG
jgi:hypothetical protein